MSSSLKLESFDEGFSTMPASQAAISDTELEEHKLASFDKGYKAGWDDAAKAHAEEQSHVTSEFANNLQSLSFTYHEARNAILSEMEELLQGILDKVLPKTLHASLAETILEQIAELTGDSANVVIEVVVAPGNGELVESLIASRIAPPLRVLEEPSLADGQAFLRIGGAERKLDLQAVLDEIASAVTSFFDQSEPLEQQHG